MKSVQSRQYFLWVQWELKIREEVCFFALFIEDDEHCWRKFDLLFSFPDILHLWKCESKNYLLCFYLSVPLIYIYGIFEPNVLIRFNACPMFIFGYAREKLFLLFMLLFTVMLNG